MTTKEIKPDQRWQEGSHEIQIVNAFGVRILIRHNETGVEEEITEAELRKRFSFVADR